MKNNMRNTLGIFATTALSCALLASCSCSRQDSEVESAPAPADSTVVELTDAQKDSIVINREVDVFSASNPLTLEIRRERSYYQADRIAKRLLRMGVDAYVVQSQSGTSSDKWYIVVSGAFASPDSLEAYRTHLDTAYHLPLAKAQTLNFAKLDSIASKPLKEVAASSEVKRIEANQPDVPQPIRDVIIHMPKSDNFQLQNVALVMLNTKGIEKAQGRAIDLPRGITLGKLRNRGCKALASVRLRDNLFDDILTVQSIRCPEVPKVATSTMMPLPEASTACNAMRDVCSEFADYILASGKYADPLKETYVVQSFYSQLSGYHVTFSDKGTPRSYFILTDQAGEYIYFGQSSRTDDADMTELLASIRTTDGGLEAYDEFHNIFDTVADKQEAGDAFLGYYTEKLDWSYARSKDNAKWARKMVGHWCANTYFYNEAKGIWNYAIFDLTSKSKGNYIYSHLYRDGFDASCLRTIYGTQGVAVRSNAWLGDFTLTEVNFGIGRYVAALSPEGEADYTERDLVLRAENLQFTPGGYDANAQTGSSTKANSADYSADI